MSSLKWLDLFSGPEMKARHTSNIFIYAIQNSLFEVGCGTRTEQVRVGKPHHTTNLTGTLNFDADAFTATASAEETAVRNSASEGQRGREVSKSHSDAAKA